MIEDLEMNQEHKTADKIEKILSPLWDLKMREEIYWINIERFYKRYPRNKRFCKNIWNWT
jgi:hypothetical protein